MIPVPVAAARNLKNAVGRGRGEAGLQ